MNFATWRSLHIGPIGTVGESLEETALRFFHPRLWIPGALPCVTLAAVLWCMPACAATWIEQAEADLTCTGRADVSERGQLDAPFIPHGNTKVLANYFLASPADNRHARFRHLTTLAAIAWWADRVNDQDLRARTYIAIVTLTDRYLAEGDDTLFRQVARCARARLISAGLEQGRPQFADLVATDLVGLYGQQLPALLVEDWPLLLALREIRLNPAAQAGIAQLATLATVLANTALKENQAARASRLLAAAGQGLLALGRPEDARKLALQSMVVTGKPPTAEGAWRAFPTLYDSFEASHGAEEAARLRAIIPGSAPPPGFLDMETAFEVLLRLSKTAETNKEDGETAELRSEAFLTLSKVWGLDRGSMYFHGSALHQLAAARYPDFRPLALHYPKIAEKYYSALIGFYDLYVKQAQDQYVANAREQLFFQSKIDDTLSGLTELHSAIPGKQSEAEDITFRLAQLRSFGRLTLATLAGELGRADIDSRSRASVERFFTLSTQTTDWLRGLLASISSEDGARAPNGETLWNAFRTLDVFVSETSKEYEHYVAFVRQKAPGVAELITPHPLPVAEFQQLLQDDEAIVATLVTPSDLYVWAVTRSGVTLSRSRIAERELGEKIKRLRAGLVPGSSDGKSSLPPFDAAAAHELYRLVFEPVAAALAGVNHVIWYGHGPLGSVPPSVLVTAPPPRAALSTPEDFAGTNFFVERYAVSALADLSLFPWHRHKARASPHNKPFLGVGAPLLTMSDLDDASPRSRSYDLAGSLDTKEMSQLPKLAESVDELKALAGILGAKDSMLWLGPDASERHFVGDGLFGFQVIALATHGFLPGERGLSQPALLLALPGAPDGRFDGILTSQEIAGLKLDADLVILSACNTASADGRPRAETFTGLTQAFFTAGAGSLMVSHWPVMSGAAVQLSVGTAERARLEGLPLARSLQLTMQAVRKAGASSAIESHPSYWGPFVIVGDGGQSLRP
jgi:CHAT domain-containing protein